MKDNKDNRLCLVCKRSLYIDTDNIDVDNIYRPIPKLLRIIRFMHHKSKLFKSQRKYWLGDWKKDVKHYSKIILFDSIFNYFPLEYIRKVNPDCVVIFCYRNRVKNGIRNSDTLIEPQFIRDKFNAELFSYNQEDCAKYKMRYYSQFHIIDTSKLDLNQEIVRDVYFMGYDKGRFSILASLRNKFNKLGMTFKIRIVPDENSGSELLTSDLKSSTIDYIQILNECLRSRCIIDIISEENKGVTYRVLESIVLKRKLITNNTNVCESEFYDSNNMFILGMDDDSNLESFIRTPYIENHNKVKVHDFSSFCDVLFKEME